MSEQQLEALVKRASIFAEGAMRIHGNVAPIWHMITREGQEIVELMPPAETKDEAVMLIKTLMELKDVVRYVHFTEAWMLNLNKDVTFEQAREQYHEGLKHMPGRIECVIFQAEDHEAGIISGHREIIRPDRGRPYLGPLETFRSDRSEGRFVGLLPKRGTLQ